VESLCGLPKPLPEGSPIGRPLRAAPTSLKNEKGDCPFSGTVPFFGDMGKEEKEPFILEKGKAS